MLGDGLPDLLESMVAVYSLMHNLLSLIEKHGLWDEKGVCVLEDGTEISRDHYLEWREMCDSVEQVH